MALTQFACKQLVVKQCAPLWFTRALQARPLDCVLQKAQITQYSRWPIRTSIRQKGRVSKISFGSSVSAAINAAHIAAAVKTPK